MRKVLIKVLWSLDDLLCRKSYDICGEDLDRYPVLLSISDLVRYPIHKVLDRLE